MAHLGWEILQSPRGFGTVVTGWRSSGAILWSMRTGLEHMDRAGLEHKGAHKVLGETLVHRYVRCDVE